MTFVEHENTNQNKNVREGSKVLLAPEKEEKFSEKERRVLTAEVTPHETVVCKKSQPT